MNEELQSSNEEIETSKEELQSMNEELNTVNAELREKVQELESANNDMANLMNSTEIATLFLDTGMKIRRFTPAAKDLLNLIPSDVGRPIGDLTMRFNDNELAHDASQVTKTHRTSAREVESDSGNWYIRRILPFQAEDNRIDGLVLTFTDVTAIKEKEIALIESEARFRELFEHMNSGVAIYNDTSEQKRAEKAIKESQLKLKNLLNTIQAGVVVHDTGRNRVIDFNPAALEIFGLTKEQITGKSSTEPGWGFIDESGEPMKEDDYPVNIVKRTQKPLYDYILGIKKPDKSKRISPARP